MARILLETYCIAQPRGQWSREIWEWDMLTRAVVKTTAVNLNSCMDYRKPSDELVDSYYEDGIFREVYHETMGRVRFVDTNPAVVYVDHEPQEFSPVHNPIAYKLKNISATSDYIHIAIFVERDPFSSVFDRIIGLKYLKDKEGFATFYIEDFLKSYLYYHTLHLPFPDGSRIKGHLVRFLVNFGQTPVYSYSIGYEYELLASYTNTTSTIKGTSIAALAPGRYRLLVNRQPSPLESMYFQPVVVGFPIELYFVETPWVQYQGKFETFVDLPKASNWVQLLGNCTLEIFKLGEELPTNLFKHAYLGGYNYLQFPDVASKEPGWKNILSVAPKNRYVTKEQYEYIFYLAKQNKSTLALNKRAHYEDGTSSDINTSTDNVKKGEVIAFNINDPQLYLLNPGKEIKQISVTIDDEIINLFPLSTNSSTIREFYFYNSRGGLDSLVTTGGGQEELNIAKEEVERFLNYDYASSSGQYEVISTKAQSTYKVSSGFFETEAEYLAKREIFYSKRVFLRMRSGEKDILAPIIVSSANALMVQDGNYLYSFDIEFKFAFDEKSTFLQKNNYL